MWTPPYDIIVETLTGSEFEVTVNERDTIGYIKSKIQKYEGIPVHQQHLLYNHKELDDAIEMKDIPLVNGSRIKLVLGLRGGPISSKRVVSLPDYDSWFDFSDVLSRQDPISFKTPGVKLLLYKDNKKNIQRLMKMRGEKNTKNIRGASATSGPSLSATATATEQYEQQWQKDNVVTNEKMNLLKSIINQKKKNKTYNHIYNNSVNMVSGPVKFLTEIEKTKKPTKNEDENPIDVNVNKTVMALCESMKKFKANERNSFDIFGLYNDRCYDVLVRQAQTNGQDKTLKYKPSIDRSYSFQANSQNTSMNSDDLYAGDATIKTKRLTSSSMCDIIEIIKYNPIKLRTMSNDAINKIVSAKKNSKNNISLNNDEPNISNIKNIEEYKRDFEIPANTCVINSKLSSSSEIDKLKSSLKLSQEKRGTISEEMNFDKDGLGAECVGDSAEGGVTASAGGLDTPFRLYKTSSKESNCSNCSYDLPKLLIREDSPVESYHLSDLQLDTLTLLSSAVDKSQRFNSFPKLDDTENDTASNFNYKSSNDKNISTESLLQFYPSKNSNQNNGWNSDLGLNELELKFLNGELINSNQINNSHNKYLYHNNPNTNFSNNNNPNPSIFKLPPNPTNYEINQWLWDKCSSENFDKDDLFDNNPITSSNLSLVSSSSYTTIDDDLSDEEVSSLDPCKGFLNLNSDNNKNKKKKKTIPNISNDINNTKNNSNSKNPNFNIKTKIKSKSIDLNECRKKFGSSPTLLNSSLSTSTAVPLSCNATVAATSTLNDIESKNATDRKKRITKSKKTISDTNLLIPQLSRLDAIPSQYRRGYTNLNDAFLSSSTSDLEKNHSNHQRHRGKQQNHMHNKNLLNFNLNSNLNSSPLLKHRTNDHLEYIRSYDNLNLFRSISLNNKSHRRKLNRIYNNINTSYCSNGKKLARNISNFASSSSNEMGDEQHNVVGVGRANEENETVVCVAANDEDDFKYINEADYLVEEDSDLDEEILHNNFKCLFSNFSFTNINAKKSSSNKSMNNVGDDDDDDDEEEEDDEGEEEEEEEDGDEIDEDEDDDEDNDEEDEEEIEAEEDEENEGDNEDNDEDEVDVDGENIANSKSSNSKLKSNYFFNFPSDESLFSMKFDEYLDEYIDIDDYGNTISSLKAASFSTPSLYLNSNATATGAATSSKSNNLTLPDINTFMSGIEKASSPKIPLPINKEECDKAVDDSNDKSNQTKDKLNKLRCAECNKKLGVIMIMKCHCEKIFCAQHRYAEAHKCTYDYKSEGKHILRRDNPLVVGQKLPKI